MVYGIIDLGANTMRLNIYNVEDNITKIFTKKEVVGLAAYVTGGMLSLDGMHKASEALNGFKEIASKVIDISHLHVFATASLRNIKNSKQALNEITSATSLNIDILSEDEEATMGFSGIAQSINIENGIMIDIGGASTELVHIQNNKPINFASLPIGCLNLYLDNVQNVLPTKQEQQQIKHKIKQQLNTITWDTEVGNSPLTMVGIGGTARATLKLTNSMLGIKTEDNMESHHVKKLHNLLKSSETNNKFVYHSVYKTVPERTLTIYTGISILKATIKKFAIEDIVISQYGVREGYLLDRVLYKGNN